MRSFEDIRERWRITQEQSNSLDDLRRAVRYNGSSSPCVSGCRSVCWKAFLLSDSSQPDGWSQALREGRDDYTQRREHFLRFIHHPEALAELTIDPLADDPDSPWNTVRQDEIIRSEIQQDVQRLPDEGNYHEGRIQTMILDILFVYCKSHPERGGYRQGMHELLAPILHVTEMDAVDKTSTEAAGSTDQAMLDALDSAFIEHDTYTLFSRLMEQAQAFYEVKDAPPQIAATVSAQRSLEQTSAIVERSKFIHEACLRKVDPELATHLTSVEILPQIFLIRWIRLLFSREFPFEQFLVLWDTTFAVDPTLQLIDLTCVAMLIRIRWQLLEADYSVCLQLLLKYPAPAGEHGPHTFVDDAVYLQDHLNASGGASLIMKYTGRMPTLSKPPDGAHPVTPSFSRFSSFRQRNFRSPTQSPLQVGVQQGGVEALFQGAAKGARGVLEKGEKLGINQAVREAMGEIRRNMSGFNEARYTPQSPRPTLDDGSLKRALAFMDKRNQQLAAALAETVDSLKSLSASELDDKVKALEVIEVAAAKAQFVKIYLEDSSMELPIDDDRRAKEKESEDSAEGTSVKPDEQISSKAGDLAASVTEDVDVANLSLAQTDQATKTAEGAKAANPDAMDTTDDERAKVQAEVRPQAPVPTRSTLAQSSFSWMLEPDESSPTLPRATKNPKSPPAQMRKRTSNNASRERNAFLFGEVVVDKEGRDPLESEEIFGLEPLGRAKGK